MKIETVQLPAPAPGTRRSLQVWRFGQPGARPKAYLQAALHADEIPPLLVLHELAALLRAAEAEGALRGEFVLVPVANPIGADQHLFGFHQGRYHQPSGLNFNRGYPDLAAAVGTRVASALGEDAEANVALVRAAALAELAQAPVAEDAALRHTLLRLAIDADIVLDLHCDNEAALHVYLGNSLWPQGQDLAAWLRSPVTLLADLSGGNPFDEACSGLWWSLAARFATHPLPTACLAATVELRGERDVHEILARDDAVNLFCFLQGRGLLAGDPGPVPALAAPATPLQGVAMLSAPHAGVVCFLAEPGARVARDEPVATLVDPLQAEAQGARTTLRSPIDGVLFARRSNRLARPGQVLCKIAGAEPLAERAQGPLLND